AAVGSQQAAAAGRSGGAGRHCERTERGRCRGRGACGQVTDGSYQPAPGPAQLADLAEQVLARARYLRLTIAVAESLTGGQLAAALTAVPGASAVFRGSVTAYATDLKAAVLGVDGVLLDQVGAVHGEVASQMAEGVRRVC